MEVVKPQIERSPGNSEVQDNVVISEIQNNTVTSTKKLYTNCVYGDQCRKVFYFEKQKEFDVNKLESYPNYPSLVGNYILLTWKNMKLAGTPDQIRQYQNFRERFLKRLMTECKCDDFNRSLGKCKNPKDKHLTWYRIGSKSPDSDIDITVIPEYMLTGTPTIDERVRCVYSKYFVIPMEVMFDMNIYSTPFFYIDTNPKPIKRSLGRRTTNISFTNLIKLDNEQNTLFNDLLFVKVESDENKESYKALRYLGVNPNTIIEHQYMFANVIYKQGKNHQENIAQKVQDKSEYLCNYDQAIASANALAVNGITEQIKTKISEYLATALQNLSWAASLSHEAYHTLGTMLHVNCPEEFKKDCYTKMHPQFFVCSVYENLNYAMKRINENNYTKASKYVERCCEAFLYIMIKVVFKCRDIQIPLPSNWPYLSCTSGASCCGNYDVVYQLYETAKKVNEARKSGEIEGEILSTFQNWNYDAYTLTNFNTFMNSLFDQLDKKHQECLFAAQNCDTVSTCNSSPCSPKTPSTKNVRPNPQNLIYTSTNSR